MAQTVLIRLLFISYAEDREFLPYKSNEKYRQISLKEKAKELVKRISNNESIKDGFKDWIETSQLSEAIFQGNKELSIPAYGGTIFK